MTEPITLGPLEAPLAALERLLQHFDGIVIGGIAVSLLGKPRLTYDIDAVLLLSIRDLPRLLDTAAREGLEPRIADAQEFARRHRVLLLHHRESGVNVDISLGLLPFEVEAIERSVAHQIGTLTLRLPTPEDLVILKAVAHRPKDMLDIQTLIETHPDLDWTRIEYWVREFAQALDMPELWDDIAALKP